MILKALEKIRALDVYLKFLQRESRGPDEAEIYQRLINDVNGLEAELLDLIGENENKLGEWQKWRAL